MSRFLFAPMPFIGHITPSLPIAQELVRRGHSVRWYSTDKFRDKIERTGATFVPVVRADIVDEVKHADLFAEFEKMKGVQKMRWGIRRAFLEVAPDILKDLEDEFEREPYDVIVGDELSFACRMLAEKRGIRWAVSACSVVAAASVDTAPFGTGMTPMPGPIGRLRNRMLYTVANKALFGPCNAEYHAIRQAHGLSATPASLFGDSTKSDLILQSSVPSFEYPRPDLPAQTHFIGSFTPDAPSEWTAPEWWADLDSGKKVVLVTQGTVANNYDELIRPAIRALANEDVLVVVTTGGKPPEALGMSELPANVRIAQFVPYKFLMPKVDALVTNGGFGTIQIALMHGLPVAGFGASEDKMETTMRIQYSGVGIGKKTVSPTEAEIRTAVRALLDEPRYLERAVQLSEEFRQFDTAKLAGDLLESLVAERKPARELTLA